MLTLVWVVSFCRFCWFWNIDRATRHFGVTNAGCILDERLPSCNLPSLPHSQPVCHVSAFQSAKPLEEKAPYQPFPSIIIIIIISFMQGIYAYIPETNYVPREYSVAAILLLLFMVLILLVSVLNLLYCHYYYYCCYCCNWVVTRWQ